MLAQAVESFGLVVEPERPRESVALLFGNGADANLALGHAEISECLAVLCLGSQLLSCCIEEADAAALLVNTGGDALRLHHEVAALFRSSELRLSRLLHNHQARLLLRQLCL